MDKKTRTISTLAQFLNPAPVEGDKNDKAALDREHTPWTVTLPALGVSVEAHDEKGEPICGYWKDSEAVQFAVGLWMDCISDPDLLAEYRKHPQYPEIKCDGYKLMARVIKVPVAAHA